MAEHSRADELRAAERRLQAAQLASDVAELDRLLDDRLIFTSGRTASASSHGGRRRLLTAKQGFL